MKRDILLFLLLLCATPLLFGFDPFRSSNTQVEEGNAKLGAGKIKEALEHYEKAAKELPDEPGVQYNLGIARFQLGQLEPARQALAKAATAADPSLKAKALYNLGNAQLELKHYAEAVQAYTRTLQLDPQHLSSKWNLELALRRLKEEEKKKKEEEKKKKKDQKDQKDQKGDQKDQKGDQKQQDQQKQQPPDQKDQKQQGKGRQPPQQQASQDKNKSKAKPEAQEMDSVLDALDRSDRNLQRQRARSFLGGGLPRPVKDW